MWIATRMSGMTKECGKWKERRQWETKPASRSHWWHTGGGTNHWTLIYSPLAPESMRNAKEKNAPSPVHTSSSLVQKHQTLRRREVSPSRQTSPPTLHKLIQRTRVEKETQGRWRNRPRERFQIGFFYSNLFNHH